MIMDVIHPAIKIKQQICNSNHDDIKRIERCEYLSKTEHQKSCDQIH